MKNSLTTLQYIRAGRLLFAFSVLFLALPNDYLKLDFRTGVSLGYAF